MYPELVSARPQARPPLVCACIGNDTVEPIIGEFAEWLDFDNDGTVDDGEYVMEPDPTQVHPLALQVLTRGLKSGSVKVCVDLPPTGDFTDC